MVPLQLKIPYQLLILFQKLKKKKKKKEKGIYPTDLNCGDYFPKFWNLPVKF